MNAPGVLLDAGPLVALLSKHDSLHEQALGFLAECEPPLRTTEPVLAEACFLMQKVSAAGPAEVIRLGENGVFEIDLAAKDRWSRLGHSSASMPNGQSRWRMLA